ncbi:type II RES/Xre toxin-antitoxin system antitoxin [Pararhizobium arenae]|uniref:type II RES/Xre toxin-antitoxin system antitoxin n=1 Tax=Pararhizobium arenae TaxID=1856850 RepID=UPI00094AB90E|nr:antitoxin Xre/MbcA/ParS toxin-binding domain-containing protein [Pararhizobium arenae]
MDTSSQTVFQEPIRSRLKLASQGRLPVYDAQTIVSLTDFGLTMDEIYRFVVPRRTLARRMEKSEPLTVAENDSAFRIVRVVQLAERVFGNRDKAHRWLRKPSRALEGVVPLDLLESESGAYIVEQSLHQLDHGIAA